MLVTFIGWDQQQMSKNNNKYRIHANTSRLPHHAKQEAQGLKAFFAKAVEGIKEKAAAAYSKLEGRLSETPSVFALPHRDSKDKETSSYFSKDKMSIPSQPSQNAKHRAKSTLSDIDGDKMKLLLMRKQELMDRLRKIDYEMMSPAPATLIVQMNDSRLQAGSPLKSMESRIKMQHQQTYNAIQHQKTIEMLARLNNQKVRRQEKIVSEMKKKQAREMQKLVEIQSNKSHVQVNRQTRLNPYAKFNTKQIEKISQGNKTNSNTESNQKLPGKVENQFEQLPQLITHEKQTIGSDELEPTYQGAI